MLPSQSELSTLLLQGVAPQQRTLRVTVLMHSFAAAYATALEERRPLDLVHWFGESRERMADFDVEELVREACASLAAHLSQRHDSELLLGPLQALSDGLGAEPGIRGDLDAPFVPPSTVDAAINDVVRKLDQRDPHAADHLRCVSAWCTRLARRLGLGAPEVAFATRSGLLHDIGKLSTPTDALCFARTITDEEAASMREHALAGQRLALEDPLLAPFADVVRWHHEHVDGSGYPDGLRGGDIPLVVRVVAVADAFHAMVGHHRDRFPMTPREALKRLEAAREKQFCGTVVDAMHDIVDGAA